MSRAAALTRRWIDRLTPRALDSAAGAAMLAAVSCLPATGRAQTAAADAPASSAVQAPRHAEASLSHSMAKAITLKAITFTAGTFIYATGTGSLAAGAVLSGINAAGSFVILTANDYGWDYFWPNTNVKANRDEFSATTSLSRNTMKYLTLKPMLTVLNMGSVYWWTGSAATTAVTGGAAVLFLPLAFYVNNTAWDWYDWRATAP